MGMAKRSLPMAIVTFLSLAFLLPTLPQMEAQMGVCYGNAGSKLPSSQQAVELYKSKGIGAMRIYDLNEDLLQKLQGSGIKLAMGVPNDHIQSIGSDPSAATQFVQRYVVPYSSFIKYIVVGNEVSMSSPEAPLVGPAMQNVLNALNSAGLGTQIKVTTAISTNLIINAYPPSSASFSNVGFMGPVAHFLETNGSPLFVNIYTFFAAQGNNNIDLSYALFTAPRPAFTDPQTGLQYQNLFDALVDATYASLRKVNAPHTRAVIGETGWSSGFGQPSHRHHRSFANGEDVATLANADTYYRNLINHVKQGTPMRPGEAIETYLFEMFDEDGKPGDGTERHFGLFYSDQSPKYLGLLTPGLSPSHDYCPKRRR